MSAQLSPVEAYRRDLARQGRTAPFGDEDDGWILLAHVLGRRALSGAVDEEVPADESSALRRLAASVAKAATVGDEQAAAVMDAAARMESAGALLLAASALGSLTRILDDGTRPLVLGRAIAQWARVERMLGGSDVAADLYRRASALGTRARAPDLRVRADLGLGVLARMRGNYPEARRRFRRALALAEREGLAELTGLAHQSLLVAAAVARDFDTALSHGWSALAHVAGVPAKEAEVLLNLATLCLDTGHDAAALQGFLEAAERTDRVAFRIGAQAGAAVAAARVGDRSVLLRCAAAVERALEGGMTPYESAQRLLTLSDAWRAAGEHEREESARRRGLEIARAYGFAELVHEYERHATADPASEAASPAPSTALGPGARRVVGALAALGESRAPLTGASHSPPPRDSGGEG